METMTVKQIAAAAGCAENTVYRYVEKNFTERVKGSRIRFDKVQSLQLISDLPKQNLISEVPQMVKDVSTIGETSLLIEFMEKSQARQEAFMLKMFEMMQSNHAPAVTHETKQSLIYTRPIQKQLPLPQVPEATTRNQISQIVRGYVHSQKMAVTYSDAWKRLFREFRNRHGIDLIVRAKNRGCKSLDYAETEGMIMQVLALANVLFVETV